jgi:hypothetical protein
MPFGFLQRGSLAEHARQLQLSSYAPSVQLDGLVRGIDNIRHDVALSPRFTDIARQHIFRLIVKYGQVEPLVEEALPVGRAPSWMARPARAGSHASRAAESSDFKRALLDLHVAALNRAKADNNISVDLLARLAAMKFQRNEMVLQFAQALERCRAKLKSYDGPRQGFAPKAVEMRERFAQFQISKKPLLRRAGQDLFSTIREIEKESLSRMRRSLFGDAQSASYDLFLNRLLYTEDGRDDYLNAEQYVMLGNYERDPDRFETMQAIACDFLRSLQLAGTENDDGAIDSLLNVPENAQELFAGGTPDESFPRGKSQRALLSGWLKMLEKESVIQHVIASYEAVPLLSQYSPPINPQQLKNALISKTERARVEGLLEEHGKISPDNLNISVKKVDSCKGADRTKMAARFFGDFVRYHRDLRRFETLNYAMDAVNVIGTERLKELSAINSTLYEFLLPDEQKSGEEKVLRHVILKADIRESTTLTRTLSERGLNPASYFSLNFYEPINKLLSKYDASTVFIEGDAVILALFEREGETGLGVARTCVLAKEMIGIVSAYNEQSHKQGLPSLELGIGVSYQDSAPMYLMYGTQRIMISKALNESDRLSSCSKGARKFVAGKQTLFNVFSLQTVQDKDISGNPDEFLVRYNISGVLISSAAFEKLSQEISLKEHRVELSTIWKGESVRLFSGMVPIAAGVFHRIVVREGAISHVDAETMTVKDWMASKYYEVCVNQEIYDLLEKPAAAAATSSV